MADQKVNIKVRAEGTEKARKSLGGVSGGLKSLGKQALMVGGAFFAARGVINAFKSATEASAQQELAEKKLNAVLKSTGGVAGLTATELKKMASSLQDVTTFGDETIINAQSLLLTFTNIGEDVFPKATETILNMSTAMGTDLQSSTVQLGKALNDPITGISALSRVGVQLTDTQKEQIKSFTEVGDIASAQKVILGELETQFGGLAEAAADTMGGAMTQAKNALGDTAEAMGDLLAPAIRESAIAMTSLAKNMETAFDFIGTIDFSETWENILSQSELFMSTMTDSFKAGFDLLPDVFKAAIFKIIPVLETILNRVWEGIKGFGEFIWEPISIAGELMSAKVQNIFTTMFNGIKELFNSFADTWAGEKLGITPIELTDLIDTEGIKSKFAETGFVELFGGENEIQNVGDYAERMKKIWGAYYDGVIALQKKTAPVVVEGQKKINKAIAGTETVTKNSTEATKTWSKALVGASEINQEASHANALFAKRAAQLEVIVNTASAIMNAAKTLNPALVAGMAALGAVQIAKIESATFARGGDFVTSGPQMIMVGDNPGSRERVQITPLSSPNFDGPQGGITLNISAPLVDETVIDHIIPAIHKAQRMSLA